MIEERAPAKINLTLHVTGQRPDGYHLLDSLVVFAALGDMVRVEEAETLSLAVTGLMAAGVPDGEDNLVLQAARFLDPVRGARIVLEKHLPSAAGIGGGSSDAAATLRALSALWGVPLPRNCLSLGADVPMCLAPGAQRVSGIGEGALPLSGLPSLPAVLVNPGLSVPTPDVFAALKEKNHPPMPARLPALGDFGALTRFLDTTRNDLTAPASAQAPEIGTVLEALEDARIARMSGSGATCFGLYPDAAAARAAATRIGEAHPDWWVADTTLNPAP
ncbi:4-diphosphocytidyl-2-C-methyl-D-erythritol kinase [Roseivivax lentus]|uniref:4-diphosphocytidyl-2-C-methyl-D-erythritol kinase n=1 Tax=Roseivivax lentus TaxID=633194 RepID=A0A1N7KC86_9RHOB|nr:4-(cytidine 5'-diphospho)-2-C-methyl-D-erythritol kinase [Roseivivax lentus]SIS59044.1 4-diphosphocytidyl-2-C-methyl-D-erythritol kinase [Roseivivax lentus]